METSEEREIWDDYKAAKKEARDSVEPNRVDFAANMLADEGYAVSYHRDYKRLDVHLKSGYQSAAICHIFPYTGWWSGKYVGSGRGIHKLIIKLRKIWGKI